MTKSLSSPGQGFLSHSLLSLEFFRLRHWSLFAGVFLLAIALLAGCKPKSSSLDQVVDAGNYFQTPFQSECQFIVRAIVSDLAEQMYYAANHRLPEQKLFSVTATEKSGSSLDEPVYELQINFGAKQVKCDVAINGPIWSPEVYRNVATEMARTMALNPGQLQRKTDVSLQTRLTDGKPETLEQENQRVSASLQKNFNDPELHEQAALLLGAFMMRDHSGRFFDLRSPLSRLTAHLAMSDFLRGSGSAGVNGQMADAIMLTLAGCEALALERLDGIDTNNAAALPMIRALQARCTGDYRPLDKLERLSPIESIARFYAWADYVSTPLAWEKLNDEQKEAIDYVRAANELDYSVQIGHQLLAVSIPLEMQEIEAVYSLSHREKLTAKTLVTALNELPEGCFTSVDGQARVRVIGWGQWANFLQRHLCHAIHQNFFFMQTRWGVKDDAKEFAIKCEASFDGLRLYPFVRRFNCTDARSYHKAVDDGFKVTVSSPQLVPAQCWNYLCYNVSFAPPYNPNPNPHVNEWHSHNPPPGTVYDLNPRLRHPSLTGRPDVIARFEQMHQMAPYDCRIIQFLVERKFGNVWPTYEQASNLFAAVLPHSIVAMQTVARTVYDKPEQYRKLMLQAAQLNPVCYYDLGDYEINRQEEDMGANYIDMACASDPDSVRVSNHAYWRVKYYLKKGKIDKARRVADEGGEVYSAVGLEAKAFFLEGTTNYAAAFDWYEKIEERYDSVAPLIQFCERYKQKTGDTRFDSEVKKRLRKLFPAGVEKVSLTDFSGAPTDGVLIKEQNSLLTTSGLRAGDVIVALNGTRTRTFIQYQYVRSLLTVPQMELITWQGGGYHLIRANPPNHMFNADFDDYRPQ
jgi:hypothetical protein